jgi:hypothetical protein
VLVFVEDAIAPESAQQGFIDEVQAWATGHVRRGFVTPDDLRATMTRALHEHELALSSGPVDSDEMLQRANAMLPRRPGGIGKAELILAVVGGPLQQVLRPTELEDSELAREVQREALFGESAVLDAGQGTGVRIEGTALVLEQSTSVVTVDQTGSVLVRVPAQRVVPRTTAELPALIEEDISTALNRALRFTGWVLEHIDPSHRLTHVAVVTQLANASYMPWRTREEHQASPHAGQVSMGVSEPIVTLTPPTRRRQAIVHDADRIAEDLVALLRRTRA